jgi:hypothetical protein
MRWESETPKFARNEGTLHFSSTRPTTSRATSYMPSGKSNCNTMVSFSVCLLRIY